MSCGCPVIVSDIPPHHEVCGDAALYFHPYDIKDIAENIKLIMGDNNLRRRLSQSGRERQHSFSWSKTAGTFMEILKANNPH